MSSNPEVPPASPTPAPTAPVFIYPPRQASSSRALGCAFALSVLLNVAALAVFVFGCFAFFSRNALSDTGHPLTEHTILGKTGAANKVAVVRLDGVIMEGFLDYVHRQIDRAAEDKNVKAVVLRIDSPGGSTSASADLYRRLLRLRDGDPRKKTEPKPLIVSMASIAASGGYYVAVPGQTILAETSTLTGSIGVYAALPNVFKLGEKVGVEFEVIKQGEIKFSGSPFQNPVNLQPGTKEHRVWQDLINHSYNEFVGIVEKNRPKLKGKMLERFTVKPIGPFEGKEKPKDYERYRADGGGYTADEAKRLDLIDKIGVLEDAIDEAASAAELGEDYRAIRYEKPKTLIENLLGAQASGPAPSMDSLSLDQLHRAASPRLWYLAPGHELAGLLTGPR